MKLSNGGGEFPLVSFGLQVYDDEQARRDTLVALEAVEQAGFFGRLWDTIRLWIK